MRSRAGTVEAYLAELPEHRRRDVAAVREVIPNNLREGFQEVMRWGMIGYEGPLDIHLDTCEGDAIAARSLEAFIDGYRAARHRARRKGGD